MVLRRHGSRMPPHEIHEFLCTCTSSVHLYLLKYLYAYTCVSSTVTLCVYGLFVLIRMQNGALPSQLGGTAVTLVKMQQGYGVGSGCSCVIFRWIWNPVLSPPPPPPPPPPPQCPNSIFTPSPTLSPYHTSLALLLLPSIPSHLGHVKRGVPYLAAGASMHP